MYVEDVEDIKTSHNRFPWVYFIIVKDVKDKSNTPKGCNVMHVEDVEDGKRTHTHIIAHNFLNIQPIFNLQKVLRSCDSELSNHTIKYCVY